VIIINKVILIGRLVRDPELRFTAGSGTAVATFTLAVDRSFKSKDGQKEADFINCVIWNKQAETIANYATKGKMIGVSGRIQTRSYDGKNGKVYVTEVVVEEFQFLDGKKEDSNAGAGNTPDGDDGFRSVDTGEDEIPF
jgi:single-strand DNA-binding protein